MDWVALKKETAKQPHRTAIQPHDPPEVLAFQRPCMAGSETAHASRLVAMHRDELRNGSSVNSDEIERQVFDIPDCVLPDASRNKENFVKKR
jgi:hypothetical protein